MSNRRACKAELLAVYIADITLAAIAQKVPEISAGAAVLGFNYGRGERHLSIGGFLST